MSLQNQKNEAYEKLTPQRKLLVDKVLENLEKGGGLWTQGWRTSGLPSSGITGKPYRGVNNFFLTLIAMSEGYSDNRWVTFKQMQDKDWHFKTDEEGKSLGKGKGASIEFFELRDRETGKPFDKRILDGMSLDEKEDYFKDNVRPIRKYYRVFNGDIIEGIPAKEVQKVDQSGTNSRAENIIDYWDKNEAEILLFIRLE